MKFKLLTFAFFFFSSPIAFCQTQAEQEAHSKGVEAVKLEDEGKFDEAIKLLEEAQKLDSKNFVYPYELAYSYYGKGDYKKAIEYLNILKKHKDANDQVYQLLGNSFDNLGDAEKSLEIYSEGLKRFPTSGKLFLEKGNVYWGKKEYSKALPFYEQGIQADPSFPSNYYRASLLYCSSSEKIWGVLYGEIFMNLERNSARTAEISKLLYQTYKSSITLTSDTSASVDFSKVNTISIDKNKLQIPFPISFGLMMTSGAATALGAKDKELSLSSVNNIRSTFIKLWYDQNKNKQYPNVLFDYNKLLVDQDVFEAYNYWLFMKGNEAEFSKWKDVNKQKWDKFVSWFTENQIKLNDKNKLISSQY